MMDNRILFVINLKSGSSDNTEVEQTIRELMEGNSIDFDMINLSGDNAEEDIRKKINAFSPKTIVAGGGDGTINLIASIIAGKQVDLGIIPLGSANGLASELGIPTRIQDAVQLIITGTAFPMDLIRINDDHISLHLSDVGINARIIKEFEKEGKRGFMAYFRHFFKEIVKPQKSFKCSITLGSQLITHRSYMTLIANANRYGTGANINPSGKKDDGLFEIIVIRPYHHWIWHSFVGAFTGTFNLKPHVEVYPCKEAIITVTPAQELQIDGETLGKFNNVHAIMNSHALKVILPKPITE